MNKVVIISVVIFLSLCIVFNMYDLDISIALTKHYNGFYEFFDDYGELPIYVGPIIFGATFFVLAEKNYQKALCGMITFFAYLIALVKINYNKEIEINFLNSVISTLEALLLSTLSLFFFSKMKIETLENIKDIAILGCLVTIVSVSLIEILKNIWGRVRFRDLSEDYHEFTRLFNINGFNGNKSFPSGHTNAGTSILLLSLLVPRFSDKKWLKYAIVSICFVYITILAVSRIVVSAHYASDVLCGFVVGFLSICGCYNVLKRRGVINASSNKC